MSFKSDFIIEGPKKEVIKTLVAAGGHVLITGETGSGKTTYCQEVANQLGMKLVIINCGSTTDARMSLLGHFSLRGGNTDYQVAELIRAIQTPNTLIALDEVSRSSNGALNILLPLLDHRKSIFIEELGQEIRVDDSVRFMLTANIGNEYSAARSIDKAFLDRCMVFHFNYMTSKELWDYSVQAGYSAEAMKLMEPILRAYDFITSSRKNGDLMASISPRTVLNCLPLAAAGFSSADIFNFVVLSVFQMDASTHEDVRRISQWADQENLFEIPDNLDSADQTF